MAGIIAAVANIVVVSMTANILDCGLGFFIIAMVFLAIAIALWIQLIKNVCFFFINNMYQLNLLK